jgi:CDP-diacylglycerol--glycerol-3-phosphate 3-phosphatidyltransferase
MRSAITLPNFLSVLRFPLALAFLQDNPKIRVAALILAMATDCIDGYLARRFNQTTPVGTFLDPLADKFFVAVALFVLTGEGRLAVWEALTMLCRDFSVIIFGSYLLWKGTLSKYQFRSIQSGKLTTTLQLATLLGLTCNFTFPPFVYLSFIALGSLALVELYLDRKRLKV